MQSGAENPLQELLCQDEVITQYLGVNRLQELFQVAHHLGDAPQRARQMAETIRSAIAPNQPAP